MTSVSRLDKYTAHDREVRAWYAEQDAAFWAGVLRRAAEKWLMLLPDCPGCSGCEKCQLLEALAWTGPADAALPPCSVCHEPAPEGLHNECEATIGEAEAA